MAKEIGKKESRGERLRKLRKAKGLSLEDVNQNTKIHTRVIKALEDDAVADMAPAYVKGLLKIYCSFLGVDPKDFIEECDKDEPAKSEISGYSAPETQPPLSKPRVMISVIKKKLNIKPIILIICLVVLGITAFKFGKGVLTPSPKPELKPKPLVSKAASTTISKPRLDIRAKEDCWLEVKVDGKTIFKGILKKGRSDFWEAEKKIEFTVGSAGVVDVEVNRKLLPSLGRRGQVIRNITVTKEGLTVPE
jgi:cytoskeletal protein RodZ